MTQMNIATTDSGWGDLEPDIEKAKSLKIELQEREKKAMEARSNLHGLVLKINESRRKRVLNLLKAEKRAICLTHSLVFEKSEIEESLVPGEALKVVQMYRMWTETYSCYDSDKEYVKRKESYETVACKLCQSVLSHGNVSDKDHNNYGMMRDQSQSAKTFWGFYSTELIDKISSAYFQMPIITVENL